MRKLVISLLLAGAAASPALAQNSGDQDGRPQDRGQRHQARAQQFGGGIFDGGRGQRGGGSVSGGGEQQADLSGGGWSRGGDLRQSNRPVPNVLRDRTPLVVSERPREGTQPALLNQGRRWAATDWSTYWNTGWRTNRRYDWRGWRDRHRSLFRVGVYYDPFGWGYQPYQAGWRLWPSYYGSNYWLDDPYAYRLPYAPSGTRWIRYWDDALLVDTWNGEVVDVVHNFFW